MVLVNESNKDYRIYKNDTTEIFYTMKWHFLKQG